MKAKIYEQGNGFPDWSDLVQDKEGNLYRITGEGSTIHTDTTGGGGANWIEVEVAVADWSEVVSEVQPFPALCAPCYMEGGGEGCAWADELAGSTGEGAGK